MLFEIDLRGATNLLTATPTLPAGKTALEALTVDELLGFAASVDAVHVEEKLMQYIVRLVQATRTHPRVALGASPRASLALMRQSKAWALLQGRDYVTPDDVRKMLRPVLEHRVMVTTDAAIEGVTSAAVVKDVAVRTRLTDAQAGVALPRADLTIPDADAQA